MKRTLLNSWHKEHKGRMVEFADWEMPLVYTSISEEHNIVRQKAGLFDLSHMGRIRVKGPDRMRYLQRLFTNDLSELVDGGIHYGFFCNPQGGVMDDVTIYKAEDYLMAVVNACNQAKILNWMKTNSSGFNVDIEDTSISILMLAIQGPLSVEIMNELADADFSALKKYRFTVRQIYRAKAVVSRTGYTGEDGFEIYCGSMYLPALWDRFLDVGYDRGLRPIGLGARDTLRTEACMPLYGNELDEHTTPVEAGLEKFIKFSKPDFIGKQALTLASQAEFSRKLICFEMLDKAVPRHGQTVTFEGEPIGRVTTGTFSPTFKKGVGMAYVDQVKSTPDTPVEIEIHDKLFKAVIRPRPLYKRRKS
ncbi:glycine cleavage system aminomethyltransferase GcvT [Candidatus Sumerlaeota bacterium]|nr:glycine cleavage system aminomethyltransferase GcvT [Candidatus Sumerlaeota bacterium]